MDLSVPGAPEQLVEDGPPVRSVAFLAADHPGLRPSVLVDVGDTVAPGQPLVADRRRPGVVHGAPGAGRVAAVHRGPKRSLVSIVIALAEDGASTPPGDGAADAHEPLPSRALPELPRDRVVARLLACGLWSALRSRPFGGVALPSDTPRALCVTAMDTRPLAPDPAVVVAGRRAAFADGLAVLARLLDGPVFLCAAPGAALPEGDPARVRRVDFAGPHPAGLPGTHVHVLAPAGATTCTWSIGYQDVIAVGSLFITGRLDTGRVVALCGPGVRRPRLVRTRLGADVRDLLRAELRDGPCRVLSGSALDGRLASGAQAFVGRYDDQVCVLPEPRTRRAWTSLFRPRAGGPRDRSRGPLLALPGFDRVMPLDVPSVPLMRALLVGDDEAVEALGGLELVEEDVALWSYLCPSKLPWGRLLRASLERLSESTR